jgi:hypothetical protein
MRAKKARHMARGVPRRSGGPCSGRARTCRPRAAFPCAPPPPPTTYITHCPSAWAERPARLCTTYRSALGAASSACPPFTHTHTYIHTSDPLFILSHRPLLPTNTVQSVRPRRAVCGAGRWASRVAALGVHAPCAAPPVAAGARQPSGRPLVSHHGAGRRTERVVGSAMRR